MVPAPGRLIGVAPAHARRTGAVPGVLARPVPGRVRHVLRETAPGRDLQDLRVQEPDRGLRDRVRVQVRVLPAPMVAAVDLRVEVIVPALAGHDRPNMRKPVLMDGLFV